MNIPIIFKVNVINKKTKKKLIESFIIDLTDLYIFPIYDNQDYEMFAFDFL